MIIIVIIAYYLKRRKTKKFNRAFDQIDQFLTYLKLKV